MWVWFVVNTVFCFYSCYLLMKGYEIFFSGDIFMYPMHTVNFVLVDAVDH